MRAVRNCSNRLAFVYASGRVARQWLSQASQFGMCRSRDWNLLLWGGVIQMWQLTSLLCESTRIYESSSNVNFVNPRCKLSNNLLSHFPRSNTVFRCVPESHERNFHRGPYVSPHISCHCKCHPKSERSGLKVTEGGPCNFSKYSFRFCSMEVNEILKMIPSESLLAKDTSLECSVFGCDSIFKSSSNLLLHLEKHHRMNVKKWIDTNTAVQYYCPAANCKYNMNEDAHAKHFKSKKYLRQHYMKVHATKVAQCAKCDKSFGSSSLLQQHERFCGEKFQCVDCGWSYSSRECLLTHCRRKGHSVGNLKRAHSPESPKKSIRINETCARIASKELSLEAEKSPSKRIHSIFNRIKMERKDEKISQETQTASLYNTNCTKAISKAIGCLATIQSKSIAVGTTNESSSQPHSKYRSLELIDDESSTIIDNHSQTCNRNLNSLNYVEDDSSLNYFTVGNFNSGLCNIETQTELIASSAKGARDMDPMLCHMQTQTSDQILTELGLSNIQTQTHWPDSSSAYNNELFVTAETQTCYSYPHLIMDYISTQTQTAPPNEWSDSNEAIKKTQSNLVSTLFILKIYSSIYYPTSMLSERFCLMSMIQ